MEMYDLIEQDAKHLSAVSLERKRSQKSEAWTFSFAHE